MRKYILSIIILLIFIAYNQAQEPTYKVQIGVGADAGMVWVDVNPQPIYVTTTGQITEVHNYFGMFGIQKWAFQIGSQRIDFQLTISDTSMKRYRLRVALVIGSQVLSYTMSEPVWNYESTVISTLVHILNGG